MTTDFKQQLWRDVLIEGIRATYAAHQPCNANGAIYVADEVLKRYLDRFEPGYDSDELERVMTEDRERVLAEEQAYVDEREAKREADRKAHGPWKTGETLTRKSDGSACTVLEEAGKPQVHVRVGSKKLWVNRDDLTWRDEPVSDEVADEMRVRSERASLEVVQ